MTLLSAFTLAADPLLVGDARTRDTSPDPRSARSGTNPQPSETDANPDPLRAEVDAQRTEADALAKTPSHGTTPLWLLLSIDRAPVTAEDHGSRQGHD